MVNRSLEILLDLRRSGLALSMCAGLGLLLAAGCTADDDKSLPPTDEFFFPTGLALSPDESVLFVGNANSELRYNSGSVVVVDLDKVERALRAWLESSDAPHSCPQIQEFSKSCPPDDSNTEHIDESKHCCVADPSLPCVLQCNEGTVHWPNIGDVTSPFAFTDRNAGARIGNFSTDIGVQELEPEEDMPNGDLRLFVAVRGDPSVTWIDYTKRTGKLSCQDPKGDCRLRYMRDDSALAPLLPEPFGMYVDSGNKYAIVTHLNSGAVTLIDARGDEPVLADRISGLFAPNPSTGLSGAVGVAGRQPGSEADLVYVTSRSENRVQMLYMFRPPDPAAPDQICTESPELCPCTPNSRLCPSLLRSEFFFLDGVNASSDSRGIAFNDDGTRAYIANRDPPTLQIIDTSLDEYGFPRNRFAGAVELCRDAANLMVADVGQGDRVYVTCFSGGQVWVIDPRAETVEATITVGRGPHALALARDLDGSPAHPRLYVGNFLEDTIAVIDLTPGATTENRVVMRLGRPRQTGGN